MSTKNKQRAKLALAELQKEMEILTKEQMNACKGGLDGLTGFSGYYDNPSGDYQQNPCKPSCVFNVFDYLDGDRHDMCHYYNETKKNCFIWIEFCIFGIDSSCIGKQSCRNRRCFAS